MALSPVDWSPPRSRLRHFAWLLALALAVAARQHDALPGKLVLNLTAGVVFAVGTLWPGALRGVYLALVVLTYPLGWALSHVLLAVVYFGLITPLALCFRLLGRDALRRRPEPETATYWQPRPRVVSPERYARQF